MIKISLSNSTLFAVIDEIDVRFVDWGKWRAMPANKHKTKWYASFTWYKTAFLLHRLIMEEELKEKPGSWVLLHRTSTQMNNTSGVNGVYWSGQKRKWHAEIMFEGKRTHVGFFNSLLEAEAARAEKVERLLKS